LKFGKIEYLNLLPFRVFLERKISNSQFHKVSKRLRGVPSQINRAFLTKKVDSAFISSIHSKNLRCTNLGIIAKGEVQSVLIIKDNLINENDKSSETSNILAKVLAQNGKVIIGDPALKYRTKNKNSSNFIDLSELWFEKYKLPFVFARLCFHGSGNLIKKIEANFKKDSGWIPNYIIELESKKSGLNKNEVMNYLSKINYFCDWKSRRGLELFLSLASNHYKTSKVLHQQTE
jgi:chorismate dehydratase